MKASRSIATPLSQVRQPSGGSAIGTGLDRRMCRTERFRRAPEVTGWLAPTIAAPTGQRRPERAPTLAPFDTPGKTPCRTTPPVAQGLYDPAFEHDACGVAFVVDMHGRAQPRDRRAGHRRPLQPRPPGRHRRRGEHRRRRRHPDPGPRPRSSARSSTSTCPARATTPPASRSCPPTPARPTTAADGASRRSSPARACAVLGWRDVPIDDSMIGSQAARRRADRSGSCSSPAPAAAASGLDLERRGLRRAQAGRARGRRPAATSGRLLPEPLGPHARLQGHAHHAAAARVLPRPRRRAGRVSARAGALPVLHQHVPVVAARPPVPLHRPQRRDQHRAGQPQLDAGPRGAARAATCSPATSSASSRSARPAPATSASFDEVLELLHLGGRSLPHAVLMMIPEAWENHESMPGQAGLLPLPRVADGAVGRPGVDRLHRRHGHRRGARPQRPAPQPLLGHRATASWSWRPRSACSTSTRPTVVQKGRLQPGPHVPRRHRRRAASSATTRSRPSWPPSTPTSEWLARRASSHLDDLPDRPHVRYPHTRRRRAASRCSATRPRSSRSSSAPMARTGAEPIGSMGTDTPDRRAVRPARACCSTTSSSCSRRSPTRRSTPSARSWSPPRRHDRARGQPARPGARVVPADRAAPPDHRQRRAGQARPHQRRRRHARLPAPSSSTACTRSPRAATACATRSTTCAAQGQRGHRRRRQASSCCPTATPTTSWRRSRRCCSPPRCTTTSIREKTRTQVGLVVETGDAREVHHMALLSATAPAPSTRTSPSRRSRT